MTLIICNIYYIIHYVILPVQTSCAIVIVQLCKPADEDLRIETSWNTVVVVCYEKSSLTLSI